jgi:UDP-N-acetylglucosamine 2-epimerase (non-hydrolysing)
MAARFKVEPGAFGVVTLHRPSNVDDRTSLTQIVQTLSDVSRRLPLVFAVHPRTRARLQDFGLLADLEIHRDIRLSDPLSYNEFMNLVCNSKLAITDSGGIQEETTYLDIPCLTLRPSTERPITVTQGTNRLVRPDNLAAMVEHVLSGGVKAARRPDLWDGRTAFRVAQSLRTHSNRRLNGHRL